MKRGNQQLGKLKDLTLDDFSRIAGNLEKAKREVFEKNMLVPLPVTPPR